MRAVWLDAWRNVRLQRGAMRRRGFVPGSLGDEWADLFDASPAACRAALYAARSRAGEEVE